MAQLDKNTQIIIDSLIEVNRLDANTPLGDREVAAEMALLKLDWGTPEDQAEFNTALGKNVISAGANLDDVEKQGADLYLSAQKNLMVLAESLAAIGRLDDPSPSENLIEKVGTALLKLDWGTPEEQAEFNQAFNRRAPADSVENIEKQAGILYGTAQKSVEASAQALNSIGLLDDVSPSEVLISNVQNILLQVQFGDQETRDRFNQALQSQAETAGLSLGNIEGHMTELIVEAHAENLAQLDTESFPHIDVVAMALEDMGRLPPGPDLMYRMAQQLKEVMKSESDVNAFNASFREHIERQGYIGAEADAVNAEGTAVAVALIEAPEEAMESPNALSYYVRNQDIIQHKHSEEPVRASSVGGRDIAEVGVASLQEQPEAQPNENIFAAWRTGPAGPADGFGSSVSVSGHEDSPSLKEAVWEQAKMADAAAIRSPWPPAPEPAVEQPDIGPKASFARFDA